MYSIIIKQGLVVDGTGKPGRVADVAIEGDKIVAVSENINSNAHAVINASGKVVAPGFIDAQNHSDSYWQLFDNPSLDSLVMQGFTTILVGNCGASLAPLLSEQALLSLQKWHSLEGTNINWQTFGEFAQTMSARRFGCNVASLVGYSTLRRGLVGDSVETLSSDDLAALKQALQNAIAEGAFGLSTGLAYAHELSTSEVELYELAQIITQRQALLSVHLRNEGDGVVESVREVLDVAQRSQANVKISHLKVQQQSGQDKLEEVLTEIETAWHKGTKIHFDVYPYTSLWQVLYSYLPNWAIVGGRKHLLEQLRQPVQRNKILTHLNNSSHSLKDLIIASTASNLQANGKTLGKLAADMELSSEQAILKLIENGGSEVLVFDDCLNSDSVKELSNHALGLIATDGGGFALDNPVKLVHPRCFGTAPRFLRQALDTSDITIEEALRKLTGAAAETLGLKDRGTVVTGNFADLVVFDPKVIDDRATLTNPYQYSIGIEHVLVNGQPIVHQGQLIGQSAGRFLTKPT